MNLRNDVRPLLPIVRINECDCPEPAAPSVVEFHQGCARRLRANGYISQILQRGYAPWSHEQVHDNAHGECRYRIAVERRVGFRGKFINWGTSIVAAFAHIERALRCNFGRPGDGASAKCRRSKLPCRGSAMRGRPVCRVHGGKGGGAKASAMAPRTSRYTAESKPSA